jgi:tagaturonate epimerase
LGLRSVTTTLLGQWFHNDRDRNRERNLTMEIAKYSMGIGDRFGLEGPAQLRAFQVAKDRGIEITPVWNKSNREHLLIGTEPLDVRREADSATKAGGWTGAYHVDADHIGLGNVDKFIAAADFYTIDVADYIGKAVSSNAIAAYLADMKRYIGELRLPGMTEPMKVTRASLESIAGKYLLAIEQASRVYRHIVAKKGPGNFITEVSFDEADSPQTPAELLFILAGLAREEIPAMTVAPKFSGEFLKGIDYQGDLAQFAGEFEADLAVLEFAKAEFKMPDCLKLSIHSGSDKFSLYPIMHRLIKARGGGIHLKTAGTTWLEEVIGLASAGGEGLAFVKTLYREGYARYDEMAKPYLFVIRIDKAKLPTPDAVDEYSAEQYVQALRHVSSCKSFNIHLRQLVHICFKIAAEKGEAYRALLETHRKAVEACVTENILKRHLEPLFLCSQG